MECMGVFRIKFKFAIYFRPPGGLVMNIAICLPVKRASVYPPNHFEIIIYVKWRWSQNCCVVNAIGGQVNAKR